MYIDWEGPLITINPKHGTDLQFQGNPPKGIKVPNYGHFGGPLISGEEDDPGVDSLDALFKDHDSNINKISLLSAHAILFEGIDDLPIEDGLLLSDPEATLYAGFTLFALTASVMQLDELDGHKNPSLLDLFDAQLQLAPGDAAPLDDVSAALTKAAQYMETGLEAVPSNESKGLNGLFHIWEKQFDAFIA
jgi:hypothetical protein